MFHCRDISVLLSISMYLLDMQNEHNIQFTKPNQNGAESCVCIVYLLNGTKPKHILNYKNW